MSVKPIEKHWKLIYIVLPLLGILAAIISPLGPVFWEKIQQKASPEEVTEQADPQQKTPSGLPVSQPPTGEDELPPTDVTTGGSSIVEQPPLEARPRPGLTAAAYLNTAIRNRGERREAAVLILDENEQQILHIEQALADVLTQRGVVPVQSFFTQAFIHEGRARALFAGDWDIARELALDTRVDNLILGFAQVSYSRNPEYEGLWTANLTLELKCFDFQPQRICGTRSLSVTGAGYTQQKALETTVRGIVSQLEVYVRDSF